MMRWTPFLRFIFGLLILWILVGLCLFWMVPRRGPSCLSNLKQLGIALKQYARDFDDRSPWRVGARNRHQAWRDLGMLHPTYLSGFPCFFCPKSRDRTPNLLYVPDEKNWLAPFAAGQTISYAYCVDARAAPVTGWRQTLPATVRLAADKKAGTRIGSPGNPVRLANHRDEGRHVLYLDAHAKWEPGPDALDPDRDDNMIGDPRALDYRAWWSDPPYRGERLDRQ